MKLDRHGIGSAGKYAVVKMREVNTKGTADTAVALEGLHRGGFVTFGESGERDEFFVLFLKDSYAQAALAAYAAAAEVDDPEYAAEVRELMLRSGPNSPHVKKPD
jgi:hypothetical protein